MKNRLNRLLYGKNSKPLYFVRNVVRYLTPKRLTQARLAGVLAELDAVRTGSTSWIGWTITAN